LINDGGGVLGRPIALIIEDDQGIPEKSRAAVEKLITRDQVVALVGGHQSSAVLAGIEVAHRYHVPYINTNAWADTIRQKNYQEVFNPTPYNSLPAIGLAAAIKALAAKRVVALVENTDFGIGLGKDIGDQLGQHTTGIDYKYVTLDRTAKDFLPALLPLKSAPPDAVIDVMLPPAAYMLINQLYEQGIAPSSGTWLFEVATGDYPDFWKNVSEGGNLLVGFGPYHPHMAQPELGRKVAAAYKSKTGFDPNRLLFQASDSLFVLAEAIKNGKSAAPDAVIKALEALKWTGTRGEITFSEEKSEYRYHQWIDIPYVFYQYTAVNQPLADSRIIEDVGKPFEVSRLIRPK
jgi:ABC-type branched-subunit amino acid transport system substrate-binding protein